MDIQIAENNLHITMRSVADCVADCVYMKKVYSIYYCNARTIYISICFCDFLLCLISHFVNLHEVLIIHIYEVQRILCKIIDYYEIIMRRVKEIAHRAVKRNP